MKVILLGAGGTIGSAVLAEISGRHEVIRVGRSSGDIRADLADTASLQAMFEKVGAFDALISTAGAVAFAHLTKFTEADYEVGLRSKLMGQVNLVTYGLSGLRDGGSITLTSGLTNEDPVREGASAAMVNGALEGFVRGAAVEMPRGCRINLISPTVVEESVPVYGAWFSGCKPIAARDLARGYVKSLEGVQNGQIYRMGWARNSEL